MTFFRGPWRSWERVSMALRRSWVRIPLGPLIILYVYNQRRSSRSAASELGSSGESLNIGTCSVLPFLVNWIELAFHPRFRDWCVGERKVVNIGKARYSFTERRKNTLISSVIRVVPRRFKFYPSSLTGEGFFIINY